MRKYFFKRSFLGLLTCAFIVFLFFLPNLSKGKIPIPADSLLGLYHPFRDISIDGYNPGKFPVKNPLVTDPVLQTYPWRSQVIESIKNLQLPFWNPYSFAGQPLLGNIQSSTFSAFNILFLILPFKIAWGTQIVLSAIITSIFMYLFLKSLKYDQKPLSTSASVFGSLVLTFSGFFIAWLEWGTITTTAMWLPLLLLCLNKLDSTKKSLWLLLMVFALTQVFLAGHLQTALYVLFAFTIYSLYLALTLGKILPVLLSTLAIVFSLLLASPQLMPSLEFINNSARGSDLGYYPNRQDWFVPPQNLLQAVIPDFFGNPATYNYWGVWNYAEFVAFIGVIPFFFALLFVLSGKKEARFFILLFVISLVLALKNFISLAPYLLNLPLISSLQPSRIIYLIDFSLAVMAAYGFGYYQLAGKNNRRVLIASLSTLLIILCAILITLVYGKSFPQMPDLDPAKIALKNTLIPLIFAMTVLALILISRFFKLTKNVLLGIFFALTVIELYRFAYKFTPFSRLEWIFPQTKIISYLQAQPKPFRIISTDRRIMHPNISSYYGIESVDGYDPLYLKKYGQFVASWQGREYKDQVPSFNRIVTPQKLDSPVINLLNVEYVLSFDEIKNPGFVKVMEEGETKLYKNQNYLPRVFFVDQITKANNTIAFANILKEQDQLAVKAYSSEIDTGDKSESTAQAKIASYSPNLIRINTNSTSQKPLVIGNVNDGNWSAKIDGKTTPIYPANIVFQTIIVPKGEHNIELIYLPQVFKKALVTSFAGIVLAISVSLILWRKKNFQVS